LPGLKYLLKAGINDVGGVLMNESITKAAGASFGQELDLSQVHEITESLGLNLVQRNTLYKPINTNIKQLIDFQKIPLIPIINEYHQPII
jgi:FO synthase